MSVRRAITAATAASLVAGGLVMGTAPSSHAASTTTASHYCGAGSWRAHAIARPRKGLPGTLKVWRSGRTYCAVFLNNTGKAQRMNLGVGSNRQADRHDRGTFRSYAGPLKITLARGDIAAFQGWYGSRRNWWDLPDSQLAYAYS